jgi:hypothetical protein
VPDFENKTYEPSVTFLDGTSVWDLVSDFRQLPNDRVPLEFPYSLSIIRIARWAGPADRAGTFVRPGLPIEFLKAFWRSKAQFRGKLRRFSRFDKF